VIREYNVNDLAVVIFDNNYTNFYQDRDSIHLANPHMMIMKRGEVIPGRVVSVVPDASTTVTLPQDRPFRVMTVDVARIYYNPRPFFDKAEITGNNTVVIDTGEEGGGKGGGKGGGRKGGGKGGGKEDVEKLFGGDVYVKMKGGASTRGLIYDVTGVNPELVFRDGRKILLANVAIINYIEVKDNYPGDKQKVKLGTATFIMRNGAVVYGQVVDFRGEDEWELTDGRRISWSQIARIYFR
jgi:hypothetical protein